MQSFHSVNSEGRVTPEAMQKHRDDFLDQLKSRRYRPSTILIHRRSIDVLIRHMQAANVDIKDFDEQRAIELMKSSEYQSHHGGNPIYYVKKFINYLIALGVAKHDQDRKRLKREYEDYLRVQRALSERTIYHCWRFADRFLSFRFGTNEAELSQITAQDIVGFLQHRVSRGKPFRDKTMPSHLRLFFQFLFRKGRTATDLALSIPRVAEKYGARLPRSLTPEQVEQLLAAIPKETSVGRRNYAMVLLLARLGLRAPEVIAIQLDDIDWRRGELVIRGKGQRRDRLPLPEDVGAALAAYIRRDRHTDSRVLFVTERAPQRPFNDAQILNATLKIAFKKTGLKPPVPYVGSHILRHTLAVSLLKRGASLAEIGEVLRHQSPQSTAIYARLDVETLATMAHPWPTTGGEA